MSSIYDFNSEANVYDDFYFTDFGSKCDIVEKRLMTKIFAGLPVGSLLEIGCGTGHWTQYFSLFGHEIFAIDIAAKMLERAELRGMSNVKLLNMPADNIEFKNNYFDYAAAVTSLEFIENIDGAVNEIQRVLKPGGYFIAAGLNSNSPIGKNKKVNPIFEKARFFSFEEFYLLLQKFGDPEIHGCVILGDDMQILDLDEFTKFPDNALNQFGALMIAVVRNEK